MLMGLILIIDESSIVDMPIVVEPEYLPQGLNHKIVQKMNVVPCMMSQTQFEKYMECGQRKINGCFCE